MHENTQQALCLIEELIASGREAAFDVVYSDPPDRDEGPDEAYEARIEVEYNQVLDELATIVTKRYGPPQAEPPKWANLRATAWRVGSGIIFAFLERDDWDTPLSIVVGRSHSSSHEMDVDPWSYERKDG